MKDDLQKMIDEQLQSGKGDPKKAFSKVEIDNIILNPDETKIPTNNTIPPKSTVTETVETEDSVEKELPDHVVDLDKEFGVIKQKPIDVTPIAKTKAPKTIAELLSIEASVAKNPPKTRPQSSSEYSYENTKEAIPPSGIDKVKETLKQISYTPKSKSSTIIKKLRTLEGDIEEAMRSGKTTLTSFVTSELSRKTTVVAPEGMAKEVEEKTSNKNSVPLIKFVAIFVGLALLGGGIYALYYIMVKEKEPIITIDASKASGPIVPAQSEVKVSADKHNSSYLRAAIATERNQSQGNLNEIKNIILTKNGLLGDIALSTESFMKILEMRIPPELLRTLASSYMLGVHKFSENQSFIILKTDSYDTARAGMLDWEKNLEEDVGKLIRSSGDFTYATSSDATTNRRTFKDETIKNQDARVLYDENNNFLFLYTFLKDRETIVFASHPETLAEIISGLSGRKVVE
ncbi:MAG: hypothetical protein AAB513_01825 [Patescibacteria group bacterium]